MGAPKGNKKAFKHGRYTPRRSPAVRFRVFATSSMRLRMFEKRHKGPFLF